MNKQYYKELEIKVKKLEKKVEDYKKIEEEKNILMHNLGERVKELNCLYKISKLGQKSNITIEKLLQKVVDFIPPAWQYPDITCARIIFEEKEFKTNNFKKTKWYQSAEIKINGEKKGNIDVCYTKKKSEFDEGPFLKEERYLINSIVEQLGEIIERIQSKKIIEHLNSVLFAIRNVNQLIVREKNREKLLKGICDKLVETRGYFNSWIVVLDESGSVETIAEAGLGKEFLVMVDRLKQGKFPNCFRIALKSSKVVTIKDPYFKCTDCSLALQYIGRGGMSVRLEYRGKVYGIMVVSISTEFLKLKEEKILLKEVAGDIAFALNRMELEEERKKVIESLKESEERYRILFEQSPISISIATFDGKMVRCNKAMEKILGYSEEELRKAGVVGIYVNPEDREKLLNSLKKDKTISNFPVKLKHKDGSQYDALLYVSRIHIGGEDLLQSIGIDVTENKRIEEALRESEEKFRNIVEMANDGICIIEDGIFKYVNSALSKISGYTVEEFVGSSFINYVHSDDVEMVRKYYELRMKGEDVPSIYEAAFVSKNGSKIYGHCNVGIIKYQGELATLVVIRDITERKKIEDRLRSLSTIIEQTTDSIIQTDNEFRITYMNPTAEKLFGWSLDEVRGKTPDIFNAEPLTEDIQKEIYETVASGKTYFCDEGILNKRKDGSTFICQFKVSPLFDKNCNIYAYMGIQRDVTERKRLEEQLRIRQRMDSLGTLAGGIAHDFNNILAGIIGYIDMLSLESDRFTDTQKDYLKNAMKSCERAANLIRQFQMLSKGIVSEKGCVDVYEVVNEVFNVLKETTDRLIEKKIDLQPGKFYVYANASELNQVFLNLGTNSVYAIEEKGVRPGDYIKIRAKEYNIVDSDKTGLSKGEYIHIFFEDNGKGMLDEIRKRAFDPLFTTKEKGVKKGQGLGLAMVYNIITRIHNGYVDIESYEGTGTTVHIYLPKAQPEKQGKTKEILKVKGGQETILVVDDEEIVLGLLESTLKKYGYNIKTATDGDIALDIYKENKDSIDVVILDLTMPKMSGKMLLEKMLEVNPDVKVIISTGHSEEDIQEGVLTKVKGYLKKPYKLMDLAQTLRTVLDL